MSDARKADCKARFDKFDESGDGVLSIQEIARVLEACGSKLSHSEIADIFAKEDTNNDKCITFDEFWSSYDKRDPKTVKEEELRTVFKDMDVDGSGYITKSDIKSKVAGVSEEDVDAMIDEVDKNGDDKVNFEEFLTMWKSKC